MDISKAARNALIEKRRREGVTMSALASEFGISPTRVGEILAKQGKNRRIIARRLEAPLRQVTRLASTE